MHAVISPKCKTLHALLLNLIRFLISTYLLLKTISFKFNLSMAYCIFFSQKYLQAFCWVQFLKKKNHHIMYFYSYCALFFFFFWLFIWNSLFKIHDIMLLQFLNECVSQHFISVTCIFISINSLLLKTKMIGLKIWKQIFCSVLFYRNINFSTDKKISVYFLPMFLISFFKYETKQKQNT